ncbi:AraC family transcriptional regulator [Paenibacillus sp. 32O-W]|jgi:AraC-type DNA-binding domain-containing proteins|uniref:helix-turn-helix transcriptional regulator n=1 Tax=Paenibacillus sp. 32O-W TaxID=1695218 RepID=UPI000721DEA2|nr:AraC family transcriptional regulator [Paenibacillus sp. 32O-W]ALS26699.1 AraC family transcriptional regulator [Paenibacillus sp. 32O-W]
MAVPQWDRPIDFVYRHAAPMEGIHFHSHAMYELYYFHQGQCNYLIGDKLFSLSPGDLILMHGMTLHCPNPSPHAPYVRTMFHFDPAYVQRILQPELARALLAPFERLRNYRIRLNPDQRKEAERMFAEMDGLYAAGDGGPDYKYERFVMRFIELLYMVKGWCASPEGAHAPASEREKHVQRVITFLEEHYAEHLTLEAIAESLHLTKPYLSNMFKSVTGTTVFKYLYNRRINQAKIYFRLEPHRSVTDICHAVGFQHLPHFSRMFKAAVGTTPEAYRRRMAQAANRS